MSSEDTIEKIISATPKFAGIQLMSIINGLYQSNFINDSEKDYMTKLISKGMKDGDYTEIYRYAQAQIPSEARNNQFYGKITELLKG